MRSRAFPGTLVIYMGLKRLPEIAERLIAAGSDGGEPAAAVERGTMAAQRTVTATLARAAGGGRRGGNRPARDHPHRRGRRAARDDRLARAAPPSRADGRGHPRARAGERPGRHAAPRSGAEVVELPAIRIVPRIDSREVREAARSIHAYALVCLTSPNGARLLFEALAAAGRDARALANATVAAIGPGTAAALADHGIRADIVPESSIAEALVGGPGQLELEGRPVLVARAAEARDVLPEALRERGAEVDVVALYETVAERPDPEAIEAAQDADYVTFTSSSTVRNFVAALRDGVPRRARVVSIGPVTAQAAREAGLDVHVEAERHDVDGLVEALLADAAGRPGAPRADRPVTVALARRLAGPESVSGHERGDDHGRRVDHERGSGRRRRVRLRARPAVYGRRQRVLHLAERGVGAAARLDGRGARSRPFVDFVHPADRDRTMAQTAEVATERARR